MLNEFNNKRIYNGQVIKPLRSIKVGNNGSSQCKRAVGAGYYDPAIDKTITCYSGAGMDVYIREFDHVKKAYDEAYCVLENNMYGRWDELIVTENTYSLKDVYRCDISGSIKIVYAKGNYLLIDAYNETDHL